MKQMSSTIVKGSLFGAVLLVFSGCNFFSQKSGSEGGASQKSSGDGVVLCSINGNAAIREPEFISNLNQMIQSNPYFRGATLESLPKELQRKFFDQLVTQALIEEHAKQTNVEKDPAFIKAYQEAEEQLKKALRVQFVEKSIYDGITVSDADIEKYFNENKDRFVKVAGGVLASGVRFESDIAADAFLAKARANVAGFGALAKAEKNGKFRDFGRVSKEARGGGMQFEVVPAPIKESVLAVSKFPHIEKIKAGKDIWVVKASDKQTAELFPLAEVKPHIEAMLKNNKFRDVLDERIKDLRGKLNVTINEQYFESKKDAKDAEQEGAEADEAPAAPAPSAAA